MKEKMRNNYWTELEDEYLKENYNISLINSQKLIIGPIQIGYLHD